MTITVKSLSCFRDSFLSSEPFNYVVVDNFLNESFARDLSSRFPGKEEVSWWMYDNPLERKLAFDSIGELDSSFGEFFDFANSEKFLIELRNLCGIENLIADPRLRGGGLHMILPGGKLDIHEDFNIHREINSFRRINLIFYLNEGWKEEWGGNLELWDKEMAECKISILPLFNRAVIFRTDQNSNHGHPHPLKCPDDRARLSLAVYYYEPIEEGIEVEYKSTAYKKLPGESNEFEDLREKRKLGRLEDKSVKFS